jgi:hypothetical protein
MPPATPSGEYSVCVKMGGYYDVWLTEFLSLHSTFTKDVTVTNISGTIAIL